MSRKPGAGGGDLYPALILGLLGLSIVQLLIGFYLGRHYHPTLGAAHHDVQAMRDGTTLTRFLLGFHYWGTAMLILASFVAVVVGVWKGLYAPPNGLKWLAGVGLFLCSLGFQFTGNLLPMDRHDVQTVVVEAGIAGGAPVLGPVLKKGALAGPQFAQPTLTQWNLLHQWVLPGATVLLLLVAGYAYWKSPKNWIVAIPVAASLVLAFLGTPTGSAATEMDYQSFEATASWYSLPLHGSLRIFQALSASLGWIGALVVPGLFVVFLLSLPLLAKKLGGTPVKAVLSLFLIYFVVATAAFGGKPAPIVGSQDPPRRTSATEARLALDPAVIARGRALFNSKDCAGCHGKDGVNGASGPNLSAEAKRGRGLKWIQDYIADPKTKNPSSTMPAFKGNLKADEIAAVATFLLAPRPRA